MPNAGPTQSAGRRRAALPTGLLKLAFGAGVLAALPHAGQALTADAAHERPGAAGFAVLAHGRADTGRSVEVPPDLQATPLAEPFRRFGGGENGARPLRGHRAVGQGGGSTVDPQGFATTNKRIVAEADRATVGRVGGKGSGTRAPATDPHAGPAVPEVDAGSPLPGIGSAVPSDAAEPVVAAPPRDGGQTGRGWLGVSLQPLDEELAGVLGAPGGKGALVASVEPDSPAARGGLKQGDIVIGVAGKAVQKQRDMAEAVADAKPGSTVAVAVLRNGRRMEHQVAVGEPPGPAGRSTDDGGQQGAPPGPLGLSLEARQGNEAGRAGVLVTGVVPGSAAEGRGLRAGDVILSIDDRTVATPRDVAGAVDAARSAGRPSVAVQVERGEGRASVALVLEAG